MLIFDNCPTCFQDFTAASEQAPFSISCGHVFCYDCLKSQEPKLCALCRDPFVLREARRIYPSVNLDDAVDAARVDQAVVKAIDECQPEMFDHALKMLQGWLEKGSAAQASFQSTVLRLNTYRKTMHRLSKAYGEMVQYEAVVRSMDDRSKQLEGERKAQEETLAELARKASAAEEQAKEAVDAMRKSEYEAAQWQNKFRDAEERIQDLEDELFTLDGYARRYREEAHTHETDSLRWRARYEQAIAGRAQFDSLPSRPSSVSGKSFTTGYVY